MEEVINLYKSSLITSSSTHPFLEPSKEFQIEDILQYAEGFDYDLFRLLYVRGGYYGYQTVS